MFRIAACFVAPVLLAITLRAAPPPSTNADKVWALEESYWRYVQANDLPSYRSLWHPDFLGWPSMNPEPLGKAHITDWIAARSNRHESLQSYALEKLSIRTTGNLVTTTYRVRATWVDQNGSADTSVSRIIHTWVRNASGSWQIISGMSAPTDAEGH